MTGRIAAILLLEPNLDETIERVKADTCTGPDNRHDGRPVDVDPEDVTSQTSNATLQAYLPRASPRARNRRKAVFAFLGPFPNWG